MTKKYLNIKAWGLLQYEIASASSMQYGALRKKEQED